MTTVYRFDGFEVRPVERQLMIGGAPVSVGSRAFDLLLALIESDKFDVAQYYPVAVQATKIFEDKTLGIPFKLQPFAIGLYYNATAFDEEKVAKDDTSTQDKGKLGLALRPLTPEEKKQVGHDGLVVENSSGPAERAGIQAGDLIVGVGTQKITTIDELKKHVDKAGKSIALLVERDGRQIFVPVRLS